jgi:glycosyltransferase involved in cell wall biosynthesis
MARKDAFVSVVCPVRDAASWLRLRIEGLSAILGNDFQYYEIIVVDNASRDATASVVRELLLEHKNIQYFALSTKVNETVAFAAGLERALGDFVVTMDLASDPPDRIPDMIGRAVGGTEIVYGLPLDRVHGATLYDRAARIFLNTVARLNNVDVPGAISTYRVFSRSVLNYILESRDHHRTLALAPGLSGYAYGAFEYERAPNPTGVDRRVGLRALLRALDLVFSTSVRPLRVVTFFAVSMSVLSVAYAAYVVLTRLLMANVAPGWATLSLQVSVLFFFISVVLAVMCEYMLQILETTNRRPVYHVSRELNSSTMDYEQDLNVRDTEGRSVLKSERPGAKS